MKAYLVPFVVSSVLFLVILAVLGWLAYWPVAIAGAAVGTVLGVVGAELTIGR